MDDHNNNKETNVCMRVCMICVTTKHREKKGVTTPSFPPEHSDPDKYNTNICRSFSPAAINYDLRHQLFPEKVILGE